MDLMTAHNLLNMLEMLDNGYELEDYVVKDDDTVIVELFKNGEIKTVQFERSVR